MKVIDYQTGVVLAGDPEARLIERSADADARTAGAGFVHAYRDGAMWRWVADERVSEARMRGNYVAMVFLQSEPS